MLKHVNGHVVKSVMLIPGGLFHAPFEWRTQDFGRWRHWSDLEFQTIQASTKIASHLRGGVWEFGATPLATHPPNPRLKPFSIKIASFLIPLRFRIDIRFPEQQIVSASARFVSVHARCVSARNGCVEKNITKYDSRKQRRRAILVFFLFFVVVWLTEDGNSLQKWRFFCFPHLGRAQKC